MKEKSLVNAKFVMLFLKSAIWKQISLCNYLLNSEWKIHGKVVQIYLAAFFIVYMTQKLAWKTPLLEFPRFYPLFPADENEDKNGVQLYCSLSHGFIM